MNFDPYDPKQFANMRRAVDYNYREMKPFRTVRRLNVEAGRGHYYRSKEDPPNAVRDPVNMLDQFENILVRSFVQNNPRARVSSYTTPKASAIFQEHLNKAIVEVKLLDTLRACVQEAILGYVGIAYCGISPTENDPNGESFVDPITLPNFVADLSHDRFHQGDIMGHRFARRIGELRGNERYVQEVVAKLKGRRSGISKLDDGVEDTDYDKDQGSLFDWADIWAIVVQPANLVVYMADNESINEPLRVESLDAPEFGPYVLLGFNNVLDELMPNSPAAKVLDMHDFVLSHYRRMFIQEDQAAQFWTYEGGAEEDARQIRDAMDGEMIQVNNNGAVTRRTKGGTNPQALAIGIHGRQLFDEATGYVRRTGGVASTADTATEARIDQANTSRLIRDMQLQVIAFTKQILQNIAWAEWTHPTRTRQVEVKPGEAGDAITEMWTPEMREGDFIEHEIDIIPDSMEHRSSGQQLEHLVRAVQGVVIPMTQMPSNKPVVVNTPEFLEKYAELDNLPELKEVADYAADEAFVSRPTASGSTRIPAGATPQVGGGPSPRSAEDAMVERVFAGAVSGGQQQEE